MSLTAKDVAQITRLLEESSFDELYLELDGLKLSLRRGSATNAQSLIDPAAALAPRPAPPATPLTDPGAPTDPSTLADPDTLTVSAPLLGTFHRAPKPGAAPFVEVGSQVGEDTIIGIIHGIGETEAANAVAREDFERQSHEFRTGGLPRNEAKAGRHEL